MTRGGNLRAARVNYARERGRHHEATGHSGLGQFAVCFSKLTRPVCVVPFFEPLLPRSTPCNVQSLSARIELHPTGCPV